MSSTKFVIMIIRCPSVVLTFHIFDFYSETAEQNSTKLDWKQDLNVGKTRWPPSPLIGWDIFDFSLKTAEWNSMTLDRKQDTNVLYQVCVFRADWRNKMAAMASDLLRHFRLLLRTEFNKTWQEARSQRHLPSLCFSGRSEKQDGHPGLWLAAKFVFFGPISKKWLPCPIRRKGRTLYSGARCVAIWALCVVRHPSVRRR